MKLLSILKYFAEVSEIMSRRDSCYSSDEINNYNEQLASLSDHCPLRDVKFNSSNLNEELCLA